MLCQCPKLSPIQARLVASLLTLGLLGLIYWTLSNPHFAYASELEFDGSGARRGGSDHNWHRIEEQNEGEVDAVDEQIDYSGQSHGTTRQDTIVSRADSQQIDANDSPNGVNIDAGQTNVWKYPEGLLDGQHAEQQGGLPSNISETKRSAFVEHVDLKRRNTDGELADEGIARRQTSSNTAYISINTCRQPSWKGAGTQTSAPPQLTLYVGSSGNQNPGPGSSGQQQQIPLDEGFAQYSLTANADVYLAVSAPQLSSDFTGNWDYEIAVSIDGFYHNANTTSPFLYLIDTDTTAALLVTDNLTQADPSDPIFSKWMNLTSPLPFSLFANNANDTRRMGLAYSFCGLQQIAQIAADTKNANSSSVGLAMVDRGLGNKPKQQFHVNALNGSSSYNVTLAMPGNGRSSGRGVVGGGGTVWQWTNWTTKADGNCQLVYDLPFCEEVAYAVPSNPNNNAINTNLSKTYDDYASSLYLNFTYSLMQIQCDTSNDSRYSLARDCTDCAKAYKQWLCAVTIPRCEDFSNNASYLQPRNVGQVFFHNQSRLPDDILNTPYQPMPGAPTLFGSPIDQTWISTFATNQSRNPVMIDNLIAPGPYKEVLPCEDLCYGLIQSCPAALQFGCPLPGRGLEVSYGKRPGSNSVVQCSYLGAVYYVGAGEVLTPRLLKAVGIALVSAIIQLL